MFLSPKRTQKISVIKELEKDKKDLQEVERRRAKRYMRDKLRKNMATGSGVKKHQSNMKWAHRYLPAELAAKR